MSDRVSARADDRVVAPEPTSQARPLVSLAEMQTYQRQGSEPRAPENDNAISASGALNFGALESLYSTPPQEVRVNNAIRVPEVIGEPTRVAPITEQDIARLRSDLTSEITRMPRDLSRDISESMRVLEQRRPPLTNEQIALVYDATTRLLADRNHRSPLTLQQRQLLATGIMDNSARPRDIDQGNHGTCNVTALEERMYTRNPDRAAALVAEVGLTGGYTSRFGFRATIDRASLRPDSEATILPSNGDGLRNYASQIFDVTALNDYYQRLDPSFRYLQRDRRHAADARGMTATGEGLTRSNNDRISSHAARTAESFGGLNLRQINRVGENLGMEPGYILGHQLAGDAHTTDGTIVVTNVRELAAALTQARDANNFPIVVGVDVSGPMFNGRMRGGHVLSIVGFDAETQTVQISNQWGRRHDLQRVRLQDLHDSMFVRKPHHRRNGSAED
ncbi:hypothetical protein BH10CYA1_BH10CYA1_24950 [soil metagenome]